MSNPFDLNYLNRFVKSYNMLDRESQLIIREALQILIYDPRHPSLRTKRVQGTKSVWEASANMDLRITWEYQGKGAILLRNCGHHDRTLKTHDYTHHYKESL